MTLCLHSGAKPVAYEELRSLETPAPTKSHHPIAHHHVVDLVKHSLTFYGHQVVEENFGVTEDGMRFFGVLSLKSEYGNYTDVVGLRNSSDKSFPVGVSFGSSVFVCDNLAFVGDHVIRRKHTAKLKFELPGLIASIVEPLAGEREKQHQTFLRYQSTPLDEMRANHAIMAMFREGVINVQRIPEVLHQWEEPECDWGDKSAYRLFNAATFALTSKVAENPSITSRLHEIVDGVCETVH